MRSRWNLFHTILCILRSSLSRSIDDGVYEERIDHDAACMHCGRRGEEFTLPRSPILLSTCSRSRDERPPPPTMLRPSMECAADAMRCDARCTAMVERQGSSVEEGKEGCGDGAHAC